MYLLPFEVFLVWDSFVDAGLKWLRNNLSTTWYDLTPTGQRGKWYEKKYFLHLIFTIYLNTYTSVVKFCPVVVLQ